jgi:hypothetical protein
MDHIRYEDVPVWWCGECGGYCLEPTRLGLILAQGSPDMPDAVQQKMSEIAERSNTPQTVHCPRCMRGMAKQRFRHAKEIELDFCAGCDLIWLDQGELERCRISWAQAKEGPTQP